MSRLWMIPLALLLATPALWACSFCRQAPSFSDDFDKHKLILVGHLANPQLKSASAGTGTTEFHIQKVLKSDPALGDKKMLVLKRYVPVLDPKDPPRMILFCDVFEGRIDDLYGRSFSSDRVLQYIDASQALKKKPRDQALKFFFAHLDDADAVIAEDAYREFARASDVEVAQVAKSLPADKIRALLRDPKTLPERLGFYAFLLGGAGEERDAGYLKELAGHAPEGTLDGVLSGYIYLQPKAGWELLRQYLANPKAKFADKFSAIKALRFWQSVQPKEHHAEILSTYRLLIPDNEFADVAVEELRQAKVWDLTSMIFEHADRPTHQSPILQRAIVRHALCCPLSEARGFVARYRVKHPKVVEEIEEHLKRDTP